MGNEIFIKLAVPFLKFIVKFDRVIEIAIKWCFFDNEYAENYADETAIIGYILVLFSMAMFFVIVMVIVIKQTIKRLLAYKTQNN